MEMVVEKAVGSHAPLQYHVWSVHGIECEEAAVEFATLVFEHPHRYLYACPAYLLDTPSLHFCKRIHASHDNAAHPLAHYQVCTWRRFAMVCTRLKADVYGGRRYQVAVFLPYRGKGVHFRMPLAAPYVVALAYNSVFTHNHCPHHRIGTGAQKSVLSQLYTPAHIHLVFSLVVHMLYFSFINAKIMQAERNETCFRLPRRSLSYAKIMQMKRNEDKLH